MNGQIKVIIEKNGILTVKVQGIHGSQCLSLTESFEREIGEVLERQKTSDFYKSAQITIRNKITQDDLLA